MYCRYSRLAGLQAANQVPFEIGTSTRYIRMSGTTTDRLQAAFRSVGGTVTMPVITGNGSVEEFALAFADSDQAESMNGATVVTSSDVTALPTKAEMTSVQVGAGIVGASQQFIGHIEEIRYYDERLTDAQLEDMSNGVFPADGGGDRLLSSVSGNVTRNITRGVTESWSN